MPKSLKREATTTPSSPKSTSTKPEKGSVKEELKVIKKRNVSLDDGTKQNNLDINQKLIIAFQQSKMKKYSPKLELSTPEKRQLSQAKSMTNLQNIVDFTPEDLFKTTSISKERCEEIIALAQFQLLGSVSKACATDLWKIGFKRLEQLDNANPVKMYDDFIKMVGKGVDPCVEDVFRCAVAQVKAAGLSKDLTRYKDWWLFKHQRGKPEVDLDDIPTSKDHKASL